MESKYSELISSLGYEALDVILGIHPDEISEAEAKKLIYLLSLSEKNRALELEIKKILANYTDHSKLKLTLLFHLVEQYLSQMKEGDQ